MSSLSNPNAFSGIVKGLGGGGGSGNNFPVNITDPKEGQILTFDSENEEWVNVDANDDSLYDIIINFDYDTYGQEDETAPVVTGYFATKGFSCNKSFDEMLLIYNNLNNYEPKLKVIKENYTNITNASYFISPTTFNDEIFSFAFTITLHAETFSAELIGNNFYINDD